MALNPRVFTASVLLVFAMAFSNTVTGQIFDYAKFTKAIDAASYRAVFLSVPKLRKSGTALMSFFPYHIDSLTKRASGQPFILTNRHIFETKDKFGHVVDSSDMATLEMQHKSKGRRSFKCHMFKKWMDVDLVALLVPTIPSDLDSFETLPVFRDEFAQYAEIHRGQTAFVAGFPLFLGTKRGPLNPVVQSGIVAQVDSFSRLVLLDIPLNPGNSGGPAFVLNDKGDLKLLGLAFEYEPARDFVLRLSEPGIDTARIYSSEAMDTVIVLRQQKKGYELAPANSSLARIVMVTDKLDSLLQSWWSAVARE